VLVEHWTMTMTMTMMQLGNLLDLQQDQSCVALEPCWEPMMMMMMMMMMMTML
jgi:hypothetical protein